MVGGAQANVRNLLTMTAVLDEEIGAANHGKRANLRDIGGVVQRSGRDRFVEEERLVFELEGGDEHMVKPRAVRGRGQWARSLRSLARYAISPSSEEGLSDAAHSASGESAARLANNLLLIAGSCIQWVFPTRGELCLYVLSF